MSKTMYDDRWMDLKEDANGEAFVVMGSDAVVLVPITSEGDLLFIEEKSIAYQKPALTLPTGAVGAHELPEIAANRELQEEVGYRAESLIYLGQLHPAIKYIQWRCHTYLARNLVRSKRKGDESAPISVLALPFTEVTKLANARMLSDSTTIAAICLAHRYLSR